jgi:putative peptide zinc metalloprotease protein
MTPSRLADDAALTLLPLSVVPEGDGYLVGDPESSVYVVLPAFGLLVLDLLRSGRTLREVSAEARCAAGEDVDVAGFAESLLDLGFATVADPADGRPPAAAGFAAPVARGRLGYAFSRPAWAAYTACALAIVAFFAMRPGLFPRVSDMFFLSTPVRSLAALTLMTYALAAAHEMCHWLAARAEGVRSRITVSRRFYFLALEIDLTGLWSLPRKRRYGALLAGMAFDAIVLTPILLLRFGDSAGCWSLGDGTARLLAAITFVEVAAIVSQFWIFARTDLYAVLITATGCVNLLRVNQLLVRRAVHRTTAAQEKELAEAHERDLRVGRWFRWIYVLGLALAAWFFVAFFAPATVRLVTWVVGSLAHADFGSEPFWEVLVFGGLLLSPSALTLAVALRDLRRWRRQAVGWQHS